VGAWPGGVVPTAQPVAGQSSSFVCPLQLAELIGSGRAAVRREPAEGGPGKDPPGMWGAKLGPRGDREPREGRWSWRVPPEAARSGGWGTRGILCVLAWVGCTGGALSPGRGAEGGVGRDGDSLWDKPWQHLASDWGQSFARQGESNPRVVTVQ